MKKVFALLLLSMIAALCARSQNATTKYSGSSEWKVVGNKVWFIKEKIIDSIVCLPGSTECYVATTQIKPVDIYTLHNGIVPPKEVLDLLQYKKNGYVTLAKPEVRVKSFFDQYFTAHNIYKTEVDVYEINSKTKTISQLPTQTKYTDYYNFLGSCMLITWVVVVIFSLFIINRLKNTNNFFLTMYASFMIFFCVSLIFTVLNAIGFGPDTFRIFSSTYLFWLLVIFCGASFFVAANEIGNSYSIPEYFEWTLVFLLVATVVVSALIPTTGSPELVLMKIFGIALLCKCVLMIKNVFLGDSKLCT